MTKIAGNRRQITRRRIFAALLVFAAITVGTGCQRASPLSPAVSELIDDLKSPDFRHRCNAAVALERVHPLPPQAIEALAAAVKAEEGVERAQPNYGCQLFEFKALSMAGAPAVPALTTLIKSENPLTSGRAVRALGLIAKQDPTVWPILVEAFKGVSSHYAAQQLSEIGPPVLPLIRESLKDNDPRVRAGAAEALREIATFSRLTKFPAGLGGMVLVDPRDLDREAPELQMALKDPDANARNQAAIALAWVAPTDNRSVPILLQILQGKDSPMSQTAFSALQSMGSGAKEAFPTLERVLTSNPVPLVRIEAAYALASSGGAAACAPLAQALADDKDAGVHTAAICAMARLRPACPGALPALIGTLGQKQFWALDALAKLEPSAVPALTTALQRPDLDVREDAVKALAQMKPLSSEAEQALMLALKDESLDVRSVAATALENVGGEGEVAARAEQKRQQQIDAQEPTADARLYSRAELFADVPPDADHKNPLHLAYMLSFDRFVNGRQVEFLATVFRGISRPDQFAVWKSVDDEKYLRLQIVDDSIEIQPSDKFDPPRIFRPKGQVPGLPGVQILDVGVQREWSHTNYLYVVDEDKLWPVEIESAEPWYRTKLMPGEEIERPASTSFSDAGLEFRFYVRSKRTTEQVVGTYQLVQRTEGGGVAFGGYSPVTGEKVISFPPPPTTKWKMVVDTAERVPIPRSH